MEESNAPSGKQLFIEVLVETDKEKLTKLVHDTEGAILLRWKEPAGASDHHVERSEIHKACDALLSIQVNQLSLPTRKKVRPATHPSIQTAQ
jgi:hypothetical protein